MARAPTATGSAVAQQPAGAGKKKKGDKQQTEGGPKGELSKAQKKKAAKKAKKAAHASWCWYCDREFQDDKVLLSHQKSKHFRCPHCPRRLNTAGGLAVHIDQVHKVPTDRIENTLPGRDSFDIEIYGMEGIPKDDLAEWRRKRDAELGINTQQNKRPKIFKGVISIEDLAKQLAMHKNLMRQSKLGGAAARAALPGMPGMPMPPPGLGLPGGIPMPPPGMFPLPPSMLGRPPVPGFGSPVPGMAFPPPGAAARPAAPALPPYTAPSSRLELKTGQVMVYGDNDVSVEEKRAKNPKYASLVAAAAPIAAAPAPVAPAPAVAAPQTVPTASAAPSAEESAQVAAGQKRARAADFI